MEASELIAEGMALAKQGNHEEAYRRYVVPLCSSPLEPAHLRWPDA